jgi:hypothetical protein
VHPRDEIAAQPVEGGVLVDPDSGGEQETDRQEPERLRQANAFQGTGRNESRSLAEPVLSGRIVSKCESRSFATLRMTGESEGLRMTGARVTEMTRASPES